MIHDKARETSPEGYVIFDFRLADAMSARDWDPTLAGGTGAFAPGLSSNPQRVNFFCSSRGYVRCAGAVTINIDNQREVNDYVAHECGHARFLYHDFTTSAGPSKTPNLHDDANRKCTMGYTQTNLATVIQPFCGKCLLRLRGWKVDSPTLPTKYT